MASDTPGERERSDPRIWTGGRRMLAIVALFVLLLVVAAAALTIPIVFESPSMWYKFGVDKNALRAGKMLGIMAGLLLLLQLPLAGRIRWLDRLFSMPGLIRYHHWHAWVILAMAVCHPICVLFAEKKIWIPLETRYWPDWVGVGLLLLIVAQVVASRWRSLLRIRFHFWLGAHRLIALMATALLIVHVLYVSESFSDMGVPRTAVMVTAGLFALLWLWVRTGWLGFRRTAWVILKVVPVGAGCTSIEMTPIGDARFPYLPGQFAFASFRSEALSPEPHPFTLASSPSRESTVQLIVKACGDWTRRVEDLQPGERVLLQGPFGRFSHQFTAPGRELILIAGGIGITPMLSMLRFMADHEDPRPITLVWSTHSPAQKALSREIDLLAGQLTGLRHIPIFTRIADGQAPSGRLDQHKLAALLESSDRDATVFVCGPPAMMARVSANLIRIGFVARNIHTETFGF